MCIMVNWFLEEKDKDVNIVSDKGDIALEAIMTHQHVLNSR